MEDIKIEDGFYMGKLVEVTMCERADKPVLIVEWELLDKPFEGHRVQSEMHFSGGARPITIEAMKACGWDESDDLLSMLGATKQLLAKTHPKYGQQWSPWTKVNKPMDRSKARSFLASIAKPQTSPFAGKEDDDAIPF
jgi:hypothetical protein